MYTINNKNKCHIYSSSIFQDLVSYNVGENSSGPYIKYYGSSIENAATLNTTAIESFIESGSTQDVWMPAIIKDETYISKKVLVNKQNVTNKILGIESALYFDAQLKNWNILDTGGSAKSANLYTNWYITSLAPFFQAEYGILFWYKMNETSSTASFLLDKIPNGSVIKSNASLSYNDNTETIGTTTEVIKIDNRTLKRLDKQSNKITSTGTEFWKERDIFDLTQCSAFDIETNTFSYNIYNQLSKDSKEYSIWISNGEAFSYFDGPVNAIRSRNRGLVSKTYLSPLLMPIYREIYNALTLRRNRAYSPYLTKKQALCLQKLCYFLSTYPLIDRTTVNILNSQSIYDSVIAYLDSAQTDQATEITELKSILNIISTEYKDKKLTNYIDHQTNNFNYVNNKRELTQKLLYKYGGQLKISDNTVLKYKSRLANGAHAIIGLDTYSLYSTSESASTVLYNNCKIDIGNIHYSTDISTTGSIIQLSGDGFNSPLEIPLVDIGVKRYNTAPFYLGQGYTATFNAGQETVIQNIFARAGDDATYFWEQVSGPRCLRFADYNRDRFRVLRYTTSTDENPWIYIRESGTYRLRCTVSKNGMVESDDIPITTNGSALDSSIDPSTISVPTFNKIINSVPAKIGFHKHGLVWLVDTENYVRDDYALRRGYELGEINTFKLKDMKVDITQQGAIVPLQSNADLSFSFLAANGNTTILVNSISIENARYKNNEYNQCSSFYEEKTYRDDRSSNLPIIGANNFTVANGFQYHLAYYTDTGVVFGKTSLISNPSTVSTSLSPDVLPYGGYSTSKIDNIGVYMPGHPRGNGNSFLPILDKRNEITSPTGVYCHLKEVKAVGLGHFITFKKGFFNPQLGWTDG
jgi:hypothetical protein